MTYKDRLSGFGEESIGGYDLQGRPTNYRGMSLEWTHGRVSKFTKGGFTQTCAYDANGIRTEKIENGKTHKYYVEDSRIVREVVTGSENYELYYLYGANGIAGFTHKTANGSTNYYYRKNLLGDVTAIYDAAGVCKAEYAYDAWGNCTVISDMGGIGALNPIRYRGYYWDGEVKLYYLNARYYDPEVGRFISQDSIKYLAPETLNGINLFAYCLNNPVMETDPDGTFILSFLAAFAIATLVGAAVGVVGQLVSDVITGVCAGNFQFSSLETYIGAAVGGAFSGALTFAGVPAPVIGFVAGFTTTYVGMSLEMITGRREKNLVEVWLNSLVDGAFGALLGWASNKISIAKSWTNNFQEALQNFVQYGGKELLPVFAQLSMQTVSRGFTGQLIGGIGMDLYYGIKQAVYPSIKTWIEAVGSSIANV